MKRGEPPKRKTPLKRGAPPKRANAPARKTALKKGAPIKKRRKAEPGLADARKRVFARSAGRCEARWDGCSGVASHAHHRLRRSQGGEHTVENLLACCAWCHEMIHRYPEQAFACGHLLRKVVE